MNEVISSMRTIKMYAWENSFAKTIRQLRRKEMDRLFSGYAFYALNVASYLLLNTITSFVTIIVYVLMGNTINSSKVFTVYSLLNSLQVALSIGVPEAIRAIIDAKVSFDRIEKHLMLDECKENPGYIQSLESNIGDQLALDNVSASWYNGFSLKDISLTVSHGKLLSIIGPVGGGKTSLLMVLLGELPLSAGTLKISGKIAYVSQIPWIFSGTVRENILFGSEFHEEKYLKVIEACALRKDLQQWPHNDMTYVGERGVRLSGGQKARIGLARAAYSDADIYIMDDPLSAVDLGVAHHLFDECICGLLSGSTRILVTHQVHMLDKADQIVALENGEINYKGSPKELTDKGIDFKKLLDCDGDKAMRRNSAHRETKDKLEDCTKDLTLQEENRQEGKVTSSTYLKFVEAGNGLLFFIFVILMSIVSQGAIVLTDWWLSRWSDSFVKASANESSSNVTVLEETALFGLTNRMTIVVYSCLLIGAWILNMCRCLLTVKLVIDSARIFHNRMLKSVLHAPIYFFDTNPVGRVLNRFSKDLNHMDNELPFTVLQVVQIGIFCSGLTITTIIFNPWTAIPAAVIVVSFIIVRKFYVSLSRELVRLEAVGKISLIYLIVSKFYASSPIYSHISGCLQGLTTIHAYKIEDQFLKQFITYQDNQTKPAFAIAGLTRWNGFHLDLLSSIYVTFVAFIGVFVADGISAGAIGLSLSYLLPLMGNTQWFIRQSAELENQMTSVERVREYSEIKPEQSSSTAILPKDWPSNGDISLEHASFRHHEKLPYVLNNINCLIRGGEKIGVVGRTGAGKSSFVASLLRMADVNGSIKIDGIATSTIDLTYFRSKISVIPQDPSLFIGTIRNNLDPFNRYDDSQLWDALREVQLAPYVCNLPNKLDNEVSEAGSNFSVGQKQLICLARAILKMNKILIIDEATANVDFDTDEVIQKSIRTKFHQCTVITIAHRLSTIIDCDRVMVLKGGNLTEFDYPYILLQDNNSEFATMVKQVGQAEYERLFEITREVYENNESSGLLQSSIKLESAVDTATVISSQIRDNYPRRTRLLETTV
ncbi:Multidrug resistance-associated protein 4 [Trichoplax sp. H2]|nr:Multidrug resistance-associated protein 4 [Trichoplax sp. H2]|eukprot:RDD39481.1 Multidrug resistance-associated protein 4 [Trichoplax sp. H2]